MIGLCILMCVALLIFTPGSPDPETTDVTPMSREVVAQIDPTDEARAAADEESGTAAQPPVAAPMESMAEEEVAGESPADVPPPETAAEALPAGPLPTFATPSNLLVAVGANETISVLTDEGWREEVQITTDGNTSLGACNTSGAAFFDAAGRPWVGCSNLTISEDSGATWNEVDIPVQFIIERTVIDPYNRIWVLEMNTIRIVDPDTRRVIDTFQASDVTGEDGFPTAALAFDVEAGLAWLGGLNTQGSDLISVSLDGEAWETYGDLSDLGAEDYETPGALLVTQDGDLLIFTGKDIYTLEDNKLVSQLSQDQLFELSAVYDAIETPDGTVWIAAVGGLYEWDWENLVKYGIAHGLPSETINDLTLDSEGQIWIATNYGVAYGTQELGVISFAQPGYSGLRDSRIVAVAAMGAPTLPAEEPELLATVRGRLVLDGAPVANTNVQLCGEPGSDFFQETPCEDQIFASLTVTNANGEFVFEDVPIGTLGLAAFQPDVGWEADLLRNVAVPQAGAEYNLGDISLEP
ncbi:MAG: hypothetical protein HC876_20935 [Chloroflexaceae bacterium]|nr:hypothetical protein [Chloroflexaceae bacterium]